MKFILQIIAFLCAVAFCTSAYAQDVSVNAKKTDATAVSSSSSSAVKPQKKRQRRDIPWVSLAHQRKLRAIANGEVVEEKSSEKKGNYITRLMRDSSVELSADKTEYANDETGTVLVM